MGLHRQPETPGLSFGTKAQGRCWLCCAGQTLLPFTALSLENCPCSFVVVRVCSALLLCHCRAPPGSVASLGE